MTSNGLDEFEGAIKLPDHTMPSDYRDVQPRSYDADYISDISSKMQVPDRISINAGFSNGENDFVNGHFENNSQFARMSVPDKIVLAGDNQHIAMRQDLNLDLGAPTSKDSSESMSYVGLITPPRTLTLEETFPIVEDSDEWKGAGPHGEDNAKLDAMPSNGHLGVPVPYDPGVNLHDSVLLNEENEATLLRTQVSKLTRRMHVMEQDNQNRFHREVIMYPLILGYFFWKILGWFARDR